MIILTKKQPRSWNIGINVDSIRKFFEETMLVNIEEDDILRSTCFFHRMLLFLVKYIMKMLLVLKLVFTCVRGNRKLKTVACKSWHGGVQIECIKYISQYQIHLGMKLFRSRIYTPYTKLKVTST